MTRKLKKGYIVMIKLPTEDGDCVESGFIFKNKKDRDDFCKDMHKKGVDYIFTVEKSFLDGMEFSRG